MGTTYPESGGTEDGIKGTGSSSTLTLNAGPTAHTKAGYTQMMISSAADAQGFILYVGGWGSPTATFLVDISTGAESSEIVLVADIACSSSANWISGEGSIYLPIRIPAGTRIAARCQSTVNGSDVIGCGITLVDAKDTSLGFTNCETIGTVAASTRGTTVDAGATPDTKGVYAEISASTSGHYKYVAMSVGANADNAMSADVFGLYDIAIGEIGSEVIILGDVPYVNDTAYDFNMKEVIALPLNVPKGSRVSVRWQASSNAADARLLDFTMHGFYDS